MAFVAVPSPSCGGSPNVHTPRAGRRRRAGSLRFRHVLRRSARRPRRVRDQMSQDRRLACRCSQVEQTASPIRTRHAPTRFNLNRLHRRSLNAPEATELGPYLRRLGESHRPVVCLADQADAQRTRLMLSDLPRAAVGPAGEGPSCRQLTCLTAQAIPCELPAGSRRPGLGYLAKTGTRVPSRWEITEWPPASRFVLGMGSPAAPVLEMAPRSVS